MQYLLLPCLPSFKSDKEIDVMAKIISEWIRCPVCGNKTRLQNPLTYLLIKFLNMGGTNIHKENVGVLIQPLFMYLSYFLL